MTMKGHFAVKSRTAVRLLAVVSICAALLPGGAAWGVVAPPLLVPLNQIPVPQPPNLFQFVKDNAAAVKLGKALFWEMQVGSDGVTACASCHFHAGADSRVKNTIHPGPGNIWEAVTGPNQIVQPTAFPFHQRANPDLQSSAVTRDFRDIVGSQGVRLAEFAGIIQGSAVENVTAAADPVFSFGGANVRQVTGRNTPSVINAAFNFNNFWDGRAHFIFNGENPFGPADPNAGVWYHNGAGTALAKQKVAIEFASLASQAVGPPLSDAEMSARGRTFPEIGRKMLSLVPLGKQLVHPGDSVLGSLARAVKQPDGAIAGANGLTTTYSQMIQAAFQDNLWNSPQTVTLNTASGPQGFTQTEANFSLFWGLALQAYMATLVSDQTPFDRFLGGDNLALTDQQKLGFAIFQGVGNCTDCHGGTEMSNISHSGIGFVNNAINGAIEMMFVADGTQVIYDDGFNNTAVTPIADDIGRGGNTPFANPLSVPPNQPIPLSFSRLAELQALGRLPFATPILDVFLPPDFPVNADGAFKVPGLRNVELTAPYFHNGSARTLEEVVEFYVRGGNFPLLNISELDPLIHAGIPLLQGDAEKKAALVAFLKSLTDPRVVAESAPFDHPELFIPEGDPEVLTRLPAKDSLGAAAPQANLTLNPVTTPTNATTQIISGTVQGGLIPRVTVNGGTPADATVIGTAWSAAVSGLTAGINSITVSVTDGSATPPIVTMIPATITVEVRPPAIAMNPVITPTNQTSQLLSGTVETGATVQVAVDTSATVGPVQVSGTSWSAQISGLVQGANTITVTATDGQGNIGTTSAIITVDATPPSLYLNIDTIVGTRSTNAGISGTAEKGARIAVSCDSASADVIFFEATVDTKWSAIIGELSEGDNHCRVTATDAAGNVAVKDVSIIRDNIPPDLDLHVDKLVRYKTDQNIYGTVESGATLVVTVSGGAKVGTVSVNGSTWSCQVSDLAEGDNTVTVIATDAAGNVTIKKAIITGVDNNGSFSGKSVSIEDALKALRIAVGLVVPTAEELLRGDVFEDGKIDVADVILILKKVVGL